jgi:hypothetical protein
MATDLITERVCYGLELCPQYVDIIIRRWQQLTGRQAVLAADGRTFQQVEADRTAASTELIQGE